MHGLIFETSVWLLAESTRLLSWCFASFHNEKMLLASILTLITQCFPMWTWKKYYAHFVTWGILPDNPCPITITQLKVDGEPSPLILEVCHHDGILAPFLPKYYFKYIGTYQKLRNCQTCIQSMTVNQATQESNVSCLPNLHTFLEKGLRLCTVT